MRILLIEDDDILIEGIVDTLEDAKLTTDVARTLKQARARIAVTDYDLLILDLSLPDGDGFTLLEEIRSRESNLPILILTARGGLKDRVRGLKSGADDYLPKPFDLEEFEARVGSLLRRHLANSNHTLTFGNLTYNLQDQTFDLNGSQVTFPGREHQVLVELILRAGRYVRKDSIATRISRYGETVGDNAIEIYIHRLRKRLTPFGLSITTRAGSGYCLEKEECEDA